MCIGGQLVHNFSRDIVITLRKKNSSAETSQRTNNGLNLFDMGIMLAAALRCRVTRWLINMSRDYLHIWDSYSWWNCVPRKRAPKADIFYEICSEFLPLPYSISAVINWFLYFLEFDEEAIECTQYWQTGSVFKSANTTKTINTKLQPIMGI